MDLAVRLPLGDEVLRPDELAKITDLARMAEDAGIDTIVMAEHIIMSDQVDQYAWGTFAFPIDSPFLEPLIALTAIGQATTNVRLATAILVAPLRPAALLAKLASSLDVLSGGRLELGVGVGWQEAEYAAEGLDFAKRGQLLTETMEACRALWSSSPASYAGELISFENIWCEPKPVRADGPTVLFSGTMNRRNVDRVGRLGDGWLPIMGATPEQVGEGVEKIRAAVRENGRDPSALRVRDRMPLVNGADGRPDLGRSLDAASRLADVGVTEVVLSLSAFARDFDEAREWFAGLARVREAHLV